MGFFRILQSDLCYLLLPDTVDAKFLLSFCKKATNSSISLNGVHYREGYIVILLCSDLELRYIHICTIMHYACQFCALISLHNLSTAKAPAREDTVQTNFLPHKSFPEKSPVNGTGDQPPKTAPTTGAPSGFNRFAPKPFITSAKPYTRMFDSPKFSHNLLPNDKPETAPKVNNNQVANCGEKYIEV